MFSKKAGTLREAFKYKPSEDLKQSRFKVEKLADHFRYMKKELCIHLV